MDDGSLCYPRSRRGPPDLCCHSSKWCRCSRGAPPDWNSHRMKSWVLQYCLQCSQWGPHLMTPDDEKVATILLLCQSCPTVSMTGAPRVLFAVQLCLSGLERWDNIADDTCCPSWSLSSPQLTNVTCRRHCRGAACLLESGCPSRPGSLHHQHWKHKSNLWFF